MSYQAIVSKLDNVRPCPNADRLLLATVHNHQVIVGLDSKQGDQVLFFGADGQLSEVFAQANNLVSYMEDGVKKGGFFAKNRRVRAQKLRGQLSEGYACSLDCLVKAGVPEADVSKLKLGDQFTEISGVEICCKYETPATKQAQQKAGGGSKRRENKFFPKHQDTSQLKHSIGNIEVGSLIYLTIKQHGTSGRYAHVLDEVLKPRWYHKLFRMKFPTAMEYQHLVGSRNVILGQPNDQNGGFYKTNDFRHACVNDMMHLLKKGEIVYGEIVGWCEIEKSIMPEVTTSSLKDKAFRKQYGDKMLFKYGQPNGTCKFYVYHIKRVLEDGTVTDLSWPQVRARSAELGVPTVVESINHPLVYLGKGMVDVPHRITTINEETGEAFKRLVYCETELVDLCTELAQGPDPLDPSHIKEGVALRIEGPQGNVYFVKQKSFEFYVLEGVMKDNSEYVDTEEAS